MINKVNANILAYRYSAYKHPNTPVKESKIENLLSFKANPLYDGPFNEVFFYTDFNDGTSTNEAKSRLNDVLRFVTGERKNGQKIAGFEWDKDFIRLANGVQGILNINAFSDIPCGNKDYSALSLLRLGTRPNKDVFIHVVDPGVGNGTAKKLSQDHDRAILISKNHGIYIGPNNGSLGLIAKYLEQVKDEFKLSAIDLKAVEAFERIRTGNLFYKLPETFHGRDVFAVVSGAVLGGINPEAFADKARTIQAAKSAFAEGIVSLAEAKINETVKFTAILDQTCGNLKTNLILTAEQAQKLLEDNAAFEIIAKVGQKEEIFEMPFKKSFSDVPKGKDLIYLGSTHSPVCENGNLIARFVEIATNAGHFGKKAAAENHHAVEFVLKRIR